MARPHRPWNRAAASAPGSRRSNPRDSPPGSGEGFLATDPPAHRGTARERVRTEHAVGFARDAWMLKSMFDAVMERRSSQLMEQVGAWLPSEGPLLDLGSGTG